jgi:hypothetical protein
LLLPPALQPTVIEDRASVVISRHELQGGSSRSQVHDGQIVAHLAGTIAAPDLLPVAEL